MLKSPMIGLGTNAGRCALGRASQVLRAGLSVATAVGTVLIWATLPEALQARTADVDARPSVIGNYLAGRFARSDHEAADAAEFYQTALDLARGDPVLLEQTFQMELASGRMARAVPLAEALIAVNPRVRMAHNVLALAAFKRGDFVTSDKHLVSAAEGPIGELTSAIARAWIAEARGDHAGAMKVIDAPKQADWAQFYLTYHRGLIADYAGRPGDARKSFERVFRQDSRTLRTALAYAHSLANAGDIKTAKAVLDEHLGRQQGEGHPLARDLRERIADGERVGLLVRGMNDGLAEVYYGLGEALAGEGGVNLGIVYLQLALFLEPKHPFALAALANTYEGLKKFEQANETYDRIPAGGPLQASIDIRRAFNLNSLDRVDEAKAILDAVAARDTSDLKPLEAVGNIMRARKRYEEAIAYYNRAIDLVEKPEKRHWAYFYSRGTCYERTKNWPKAEADLEKALELFPDQPLVLNYLGYSWVDQGINLEDGLALIEKAVALRPDDGYIVDSLGWAHYRLGDYKTAVKYLERAVELKPDDPTLNDHLGDALWRVDRQLEARFQWDQALSLKPEPEEVPKIQDKLANGLPAPTPAVQQARQPAKPKQAIVSPPRKRAQAVPKRTPAQTPTPAADPINLLFE
jgi:tetratricopeptide (TPR) repeat protein